jgi:hypothetical protein
MTITDWVGSIGVTILLLAFFFNLTARLSKDSISYILMNVIGAGMACVASIMLNYIPFIILEAAWTLVSLISLVRVTGKRVSN